MKNYGAFVSITRYTDDLLVMETLTSWEEWDNFNELIERYDLNGKGFVEFKISVEG